MSILKQVTFDNARRRKDKTFSFSFTTDLEQNKEDINTIFENVDNAGVLYFKSNGVLTEEEIKALEVAKIPKEGKSKSQRLRSVLYILWSQGNKDKEFTDFYADKLEEIIQHFKDKLDND